MYQSNERCIVWSKRWDKQACRYVRQRDSWELVIRGAFKNVSA